MKLYSDYKDYFDSAFDLTGKPFIRFSTDYFSRRDALKLLQNSGIQTVTHGLVRDLIYYHSKDSLVVYLDEKVHRAEDKLISKPKFDRLDYFDYYASVVFGIPAVSYRVLNIGNRQWKLKYQSDDEFFSNHGNVEITLIKELDGIEKVKAPLHGRNFWAIDYVTNGFDDLACDFNTSPGLKGTPIEDILKPSEVYQLLVG